MESLESVAAEPGEDWIQSTGRCLEERTRPAEDWKSVGVEDTAGRRCCESMAFGFRTAVGGGV